MKQSNPLHPPLSRSARVLLSTRGHTTEAAYRLHITRASASTHRQAFQRACTEWALCHGLEPNDGAYLCELRPHALTLKELGEALAICGQSREMVSSTVGRLLTLGFLEHLIEGAPRRMDPTVEMARRELAAAEAELDSIRRQPETEIAQELHRSMVDPPLRHAMSRLVVAQRFLAKLVPSPV